MDFQADRELWDATELQPLPGEGDISYWGFSRLENTKKSFQLTVYRNGRRESAFVSHEHAPMLVFFDLAYWTAYVDYQLTLDKNIGHNLCYLYKLRCGVTKEIFSTQPGCTTLLFWAVRTIRGKNHFPADASELQKEGAYSRLPDSKGKIRLVIPRTA